MGKGFLKRLSSLSIGIKNGPVAEEASAALDNNGYLSATTASAAASLLK